MPEVVVVEAVAPWATWRSPEALTYHRSLPLPPYTTMVGLLGAALGVGLADAYRFVAEGGIRLGVGGWSEGQARDLWKFQKLKDKEVESDVLLREVWIDMRLAILIECQEKRTSRLVAAALAAPSFPLTAGPSDALLKAVEVRSGPAEPVATRSLAYTMVFREILPNYSLVGSLEDLPLHRSIRAPMIERLPTGFDFDSQGRRRLRGRAVVSFVGDPIDLDSSDHDVPGYRVDCRSQALRASPTFTTWKEKITWIVPVHRFDSPPMPVENS